MSKVLVVVAHADDEALGCSGTIARLVAEGNSVHVVYMADGVGSRGGNLSFETQLRNASRDQALAILGVSEWNALDFYDNQMDSVPLLEVVRALEPIIQFVSPDIIYTHHYGDLNVDHRVTHQAVMTACRPSPSCTVRRIFSFEVVSSTEWASPGLAPFIPNTYVDISAYHAVKRRALEAYAFEMREAPHSRSLARVEYLFRHHGSCIGG